MRCKSWSSILVLGAALVGLSPGADDKKTAPPKFTAEQIDFYEKQVQPILQKNCYKCHAGKQDSGGMKLDSRAGLLAGGDTGPAIDVKKPAASLILAAINQTGSLEMPPKGKLRQADL